MIFNSTDAECLAILHMTRAHIFALCNLFRGRDLVRENSVCSVEEQIAMFLHVFVTTRGSGLFTSLLGGPLRQLVECSIEFSMLLVSLVLK
jgi:hypothetical protein